jgi:hypothetical protein
VAVLVELELDVLAPAPAPAPAPGAAPGLAAGVAPAPELLPIDALVSMKRSLPDEGDVELAAPLVAAPPPAKPA